MFPATTWSWSGSPRAVSLGRRQIATSRTRRYRVRMLICGWPRYRWIRGRVHGPGRASSAAIRLVSWRPPGRGRPHRGRSASPASPSLLNRLIQRRTVAGWQSSSTAIWAGGNPCSDSRTITARVACRHWPCRSPRTCSISEPRPLANTLTGRILTTTSPGGGTMWATSIQPLARPVSTSLFLPVSQQVPGIFLDVQRRVRAHGRMQSSPGPDLRAGQVRLIRPGVPGDVVQGPSAGRRGSVKGPSALQG